MSADISARLAWPNDAPAIARVQTAAWQDMYGNVLPREVAERNVGRAATNWRQLIEKPPHAKVRVLVALERAAVRGVALVHPSQDPDLDPMVDAEVAEFAIDPEFRRLGHGSRLLQAAMDTLRADKFTTAHWWVATTHDVLRAFVTDSGWHTDGAHRELADESEYASIKQVRLHTALA